VKRTGLNMFSNCIGLIKQPFKNPATVLEQRFTQAGLQLCHIPSAGILELLLYQIDKGFGLPQ